VGRVWVKERPCMGRPHSGAEKGRRVARTLLTWQPSSCSGAESNVSRCVRFARFAAGEAACGWGREAGGTALLFGLPLQF